MTETFKFKNIFKFIILESEVRKAPIDDKRILII